ncbi:lipid II:glycine glycyltransferase FemX [Actinobaculum suis]|uniref:lipid II:glycine glycyltransferase FemX n=1 Tax=Actinobaculum suis TaxID=1657 RepID=UPI00066FD945|nr:peptidoglycan bridge formation glycyltransferase FemA/FemB family protein [Actinobaculum suis]
MMRFRPLTASEYTNFVKTAPRLFVQQLPEYAQARTELGSRVEFVGVVEETPGPDGQAGEPRVLAAASIRYQPWRRFFWRTHIQYGPTIDWSDLPLVKFFFAGLREYLAKQKRVLSLRVTPRLDMHTYEDIKIVADNPAAGPALDVLSQIGFQRVNIEFFDRGDIPGRFIYVKDIAGLDFEEATATLAKGLRRRFHNEGRYGVTVKFLGPEDFGYLDGLHESTTDRVEGMPTISEDSRRLYISLMKHLGRERSFVCVAFFSPVAYISQLETTREESLARIEVLQERKQTKARDRELAELDKTLTHTAEQIAAAQEVHEKYGDNIPINSALGFQCNQELILLLGGMDKRFTQFARDYPVERAAFKWACDRQLDIYNTFAVSGIWDETAPDAPVIRFKRWLNGRVEEYPGTYDLALSPLARPLGATEGGKTLATA